MTPTHRLRKVRTDLAHAIESYPGGYLGLATKIGCTREALYQLVSPSSGKRPGLDMAAALEKEVGISMRRWAARYQPPKHGKAA